jgi:hypothetical protein
MCQIKFSLLLFFLISYFLGYAQKDFQNGYIITNENDTLIGLVKDRKEPPFGKLYNKIVFKKGHKKKKYGPNDISAYRKGNEQFEILWFQDNSYPFQGEYLSSPNYGNKSFFKVIVRGYLSYYHWEFEDAESDYIDVIDFYKREDEDFFARVSQGIFGLKKKSLGKYFNDYPELASKIEYGEIKNPVEIVKKYNLWKKENDE